MLVTLPLATVTSNTCAPIGCTTLALGGEQASGGALVLQVGYDKLRISLADLSANITGTATVNTVSGISGTSATGTVKLWSLIDTTSAGDETWTIGVAN